jgi:acyl carrier protein
LLFLDQLPLTSNGKLDRKALPAADARQPQVQYLAPRNAFERQVAGIWCEVLQVEQVGLSDNFFGLGGHSLLATQIISRLRQVLNLQVPLHTLFSHSTLQAFVEAMDVKPVAESSIPLAERNQPLALSYAQERQWFLWQLEPLSSAYNIPTALRLRGELNLAALEQAFNALIARHETLRTTFAQLDERSVQVIRPSCACASAANASKRCRTSRPDNSRCSNCPPTARARRNRASAVRVWILPSMQIWPAA